MTPERAPVWTTSFLDLCMVLLGFFVMLHAVSAHQSELVKGLHSSFGTETPPNIQRHHIAPNRLFQPGEALFRAGRDAELATIGSNAARAHATVTIESVGIDPATNRFDGWELAAARTAAVARAIKAGGLSDRAIEISIPGSPLGTTRAKGQRIAITVTSKQ